MEKLYLVVLSRTNLYAENDISKSNVINSDLLLNSIINRKVKSQSHFHIVLHRDNLHLS